MKLVGGIFSVFLAAVRINDIEVSQLQFSVHRFIVLYADDMLLMAPPVTEHQRLYTYSR